MTNIDKIKSIEEHITLAGLLPGVNLGYLPPEESAKLKRAVLDLCRQSHVRGFNAGADHAINAVANVIWKRRDASRTQQLKRRFSALLRESWRDYKASLRSIRATVIGKFREE
jgi:hypothetical protein